MRKSSIILLLALLALSTRSNAQQEPQYGFYMFNKAIWNPAYTGSTDNICGTLIYRNQYLSFANASTNIDKDRAPTTFSFDVHGKIPTTNVGVGFYAVSDVENFERTTSLGAMGSYSYTLKNGGTISGGLSIGVISAALDANWIPPQTTNDPRLPLSAADSKMDLGFGLYYKTLDWYAGVSARHINSPTLEWASGNASTEVKKVPVYFLTGGYTYRINNDNNRVIQPSAIAFLDEAKWKVRLNAIYLHKQRYFGGLSYGLERVNALALMAGLYVPAGKNMEYKVGINYDIPTSSVASFGSSIEAMVGICFKVKLRDIPTIIDVDPRHLNHDPFN